MNARLNRMNPDAGFGVESVQFILEANMTTPHPDKLRPARAAPMLLLLALGAVSACAPVAIGAGLGAATADQTDGSVRKGAATGGVLGAGAALAL